MLVTNTLDEAKFRREVAEVVRPSNLRMRLSLGSGGPVGIAGEAGCQLPLRNAGAANLTETLSFRSA